MSAEQEQSMLVCVTDLIYNLGLIELNSFLR